MDGQEGPPCSQKEVKGPRRRDAKNTGTRGVCGAELSSGNTIHFLLGTARRAGVSPPSHKWDLEKLSQPLGHRGLPDSNPAPGRPQSVCSALWLCLPKVRT